MPSVGSHTCLQLLAIVFYSDVNGIGRPYHQKCVFKLKNSFWLRLYFVKRLQHCPETS